MLRLTVFCKKTPPKQPPQIPQHPVPPFPNKPKPNPHPKSDILPPMYPPLYELPPDRKREKIF